MTANARILLDRFGSLGGVDTTCHLGQWPYRLGAGADVDDLRAHARRHGLPTLWVSHLAALYGFDTRTGNEALRAQCAGDDLFRLFAVIDPSAPCWEREIESAATTGFSGIRLSPGEHATPPASLAPVIRRAGELGLLPQIIVRLDDPRVRHPRSPARDIELHDLADALRCTQSVPVVLSGLNMKEWLELDRHFGDDAPCGIHLDTWHVNGPTFVADRFAEAPERWLFGSGFPVQTPEATILPLMAADLSDDDLDRIAHGNAERLVPRLSTR